MGSAADEIDRQIKETRGHLDDSLEQLERRAASNARRLARITVIAIGALAVAGAGFFIYRRMTRPSRNQRIQRMALDAVRELPDSLRELPGQVTSRLKKPFPAVAASATSAILERVGGSARSLDATAD